MHTADDHDTVDGVPREMACGTCGHVAHAGYCLDDLIDGVRCPCHAPIPGAGR